MCFSAGASFTAGVLLTFTGTETLRKVHKPSQIGFASIPIFFGFQQFAEGVLWLVINKPQFAGLQAAMTTIFLIMAQIVWPILVPLSVLLMEKHKIRKKILILLLAVGTIVALYSAYSLIFFHVHAEISSLHIAYISDFKDPFDSLALALYVIATLAPFFISSIKRTHILGIIIGISFIISFVFFTKYLISVWCFFAAVVSFIIFYTIRDEHRKKRLEKQGS
jgi:hypothetical protein